MKGRRYPTAQEKIREEDTSDGEINETSVSLPIKILEDTTPTRMMSVYAMYVRTAKLLLNDLRVDADGDRFSRIRQN